MEESEQLASKLKEANINYQVLNAKNDEMEAKIIAKAGSIGAVTVSTNMAGRGTDIKLGGENEEEKEKAMALGGLYVIGTNRHESRRIDNQLRGRAGRQGDPGSARFFISLEDDLLKRYNIESLIPKPFLPAKQNEPVGNKILQREIASAQRIIEGQNFEIRRTLTKYSVVLEQQRKIIHKLRMDILFDEGLIDLMASRLTERYKNLSFKVGKRAVRIAEKQVSLYVINKCWADYLDYLSYTRESIHLVNMAGKTPLYEYNKIAVTAFETFKKEIEDEIINILSNVQITKDGIDMEKEGLKAPTSTWTYLVNDSPEQLGINKTCANLVYAAANFPLWLWWALYNRFFKKFKK